jgi:hypothetical protein
MTQYKSVKVPEELINEVLKLIGDHKELGYRTHTEFVIEAIRKRVEEIKKTIK